MTLEIHLEALILEMNSSLVGLGVFLGFVAIRLPLFFPPGTGFPLSLYTALLPKREAQF